MSIRLSNKAWFTPFGDKFGMLCISESVNQGQWRPIKSCLFAACLLGACLQLACWMLAACDIFAIRLVYLMKGSLSITTFRKIVLSFICHVVSIVRSLGMDCVDFKWSSTEFIWSKLHWIVSEHYYYIRILNKKNLFRIKFLHIYKSWDLSNVKLAQTA